MTYLISGEDNLLQKEIDDILEKEKDVSIIKYDMSISSLTNVIEDINTINLFACKKVLIVDNMELVLDYDNLLKYLDNQNESILILLYHKMIDKRSVIFKNISQKVKIIDTTDNMDFISFIKKELNGYKISKIDMLLLQDYCSNNYFRLKEEIKKLKMYKYEEKNITKEDIKHIVVKGFVKYIFDFLNEIKTGNKKMLFDIYDELINNNEDELRLISSLFNNFKQLYKVKILSKTLPDDEIMSIMNIKHPYRLQKLKEQSYKFSEKELLQKIFDLGNLDIKIKSGKVDKKIGFETFLAKL